MRWSLGCLLANQSPLAADRKIQNQFFVSVEQGLGCLIDPAILIGPELTGLVDDGPGRLIGQSFLVVRDPFELDRSILLEPIEDGLVVGTAVLGLSADMDPGGCVAEEDRGSVIALQPGGLCL
jgi:hypothetical protein